MIKDIAIGVALGGVLYQIIAFGWVLLFAKVISPWLMGFLAQRQIQAIGKAPKVNPSSN